MLSALIIYRKLPFINPFAYKPLFEVVPSFRALINELTLRGSSSYLDDYKAVFCSFSFNYINGLQPFPRDSNASDKDPGGQVG